MTNLINIQGLTKKYQQKEVVSSLDLKVEKGSLFAFLGPNGAGKSTTINMISTAIKPTSGSIFVDGLEVGKENSKIRQKIGIVFQDNVLDDLLTVEENLLFWGKIYSLSKNELNKQLDFLENLLHLTDILKQRFGTLSGGQKRRAEIARAIIHRPLLLILDEPTTGLDPKTRVQVWQTITYLREKLGMTVFLTTHYMEEAAEADKIAVINHGELIALGTPNQLRNKYSRDSLNLYKTSLEDLKIECEKRKLGYTEGIDFIRIQVRDTDEALHLLNELNDLYQSFEVRKGNLDDVFLALIKGGTNND
ncbi:MAG: ABC transporter ATP-binding protein [Carnobacterium sp.]|uniref:ABC transporter ATP-binding protein n=1 Tax=Carnobacterium TaxID=2747 RepID=UPI000704CF6A|nr:ABC transporter ATP-binding protein [Carnobacterium maltaromaticum]KRN71518.1 ABC transporter ATP-binding protein [Carnobacterium maltaromaticum]MBC9787116.1 ATP-binding cassette domain-containing protein [Carnobacterium maltaromaticum]MBC9808423.1 ATP-binding cassette domain-containing protein [Carnobacterium maltaromaticum]MDW5522264.1 ABC transporter ATP-binding protein [Carnobacterium maltaromaticum]TFJ75853.1 ABC transporter ATP-binding protein [Carnobacterium maltaromaticum]